ncbi:ABC transporter ATP-binding protein YtrB [Paenibacillus sp. JJ-100]|uniref:ABC transporter ATP-binding protein n=1 Tax=Paenibacillus sp. JJ-100 TaxID=2974896 RepID=UPI0022FFA5D7|nr:ABC transporter ATP-binding protein [Paenibacillus sp. JJ-100]CAI6081685.1 ABC transporter ATP-binding protein YtrB [Paenibacillus sp. JJ-100]
MIELNQVMKTFESEKAVDGVTMHIHKGSIYGLLGSNGAGKTSLLKIIAGIYRQDSGTVRINGTEIYENLDLKGRTIFMADSPYFFPQSSIHHMAAFYRSVYPRWSEERFKQLASVFKLDVKRKLHRMSKGMRRQAAVWLGLSCMPEILLMDEPIDGLDPVMRQQIKNLLFQEAAERQVTIIISSHNLREIEDLCDHVGIMHKGQIIVQKDLDDLKADTHKIQVAFRHPDHAAVLKEQVHILHEEKRGSVSLYIVKGQREQVTEQFRLHDPYLLDVLPLTLEEIFIYEMEGAGYDIQPIIL